MTFDEILQEHGPALWRVIAGYTRPGAERHDLPRTSWLPYGWRCLNFAAKDRRGRTFCASLITAVSRMHGAAQSCRHRTRSGQTWRIRPGADEQLATNERAEQFPRFRRGARRRGPRLYPPGH